MEHTLGNWYIDCKDETKAAKIRSAIHKEGQGICLVYPNKEWEANAILISEAPETKAKLQKAEKRNGELVEALRIVKDYIEYPYTHHGTTRIRKAVEKALKNNNND